ncbi:MAG: radical SAM family heme chaperone HemW [Pseudomonadota bacterium]
MPSANWRRLLVPDWQNAGFGIYIHWPFCQAKCPYCDFNSYVGGQVDFQRWQDAYLAEIARYREETGPRVLNTIFFGGGTPSLMSPDLVAGLISRIRETWQSVNNLEVTLEANPTSVEAAKFRAFHEAGVNRISIGVQSLRDRHLRALGRMHTANEGRIALETAQKIFDRVSCDLIYARQNQTEQEWREELQDALALGTRHLSLYQLTIEDGTVFADRFKRGRLKGLPDDDIAADQWDVTQELCDAAGLPAYEVSNHAAPGEESAHNLIYWRYGDYLGLGPGAHGRLTANGKRWATVAVRRPDAWLEAVESGETGEEDRVDLPKNEQAEEYLMMSLRLSDGCDLKRLANLHDKTINPGALAEMQDAGMLWRQADRIGCTSDGRPVLNAVTRALLA